MEFEFFKLKPGEFVAYADGKERKIRFFRTNIERKKPPIVYEYSDEELHKNYARIFQKAKSLLE